MPHSLEGNRWLHLNRDVTTVQRWEKRESMPSIGTCATKVARSMRCLLNSTRGLKAADSNCNVAIRGPNLMRAALRSPVARRRRIRALP